MGYTTLNKTNTLYTNAMQFMSNVLWVMTKTKHRGTDAQDKAIALKINSVISHEVFNNWHWSLLFV